MLSRSTERGNEERKGAAIEKRKGEERFNGEREQILNSCPRFGYGGACVHFARSDRVRELERGLLYEPHLRRENRAIAEARVREGQTGVS